MYCWEAANSFEICSFSASAKVCSATPPAYSDSPAEARRVGHRLERARGQAGLGARGVVARGSHVVRRVGGGDRRQVLDGPAAGSQLPLPPAVGADSVGVAVVVSGEELVQRPEAGGLDVDHLGR